MGHIFGADSENNNSFSKSGPKAPFLGPKNGEKGTNVNKPPKMLTTLTDFDEVRTGVQK